MGNQKLDDSTLEYRQTETIPIVVLGVLVALVVFGLIIFCVFKKKKKENDENKPANLEDGEVKEELITSNNQNQVHATPNNDSQLKQGIRENPTNGLTPTFEFPSAGNPEHRKWYESKAIPFMDASVGSIPEATNGERV